MDNVGENVLSSATVLRWLGRCAALYQENKDELTRLDAAIGDADHGANMARGFGAVQGKLASLEGQDIGAIFKAVAMTLISTVGGASGPLYGTFFLQAAGKAAGKKILTPDEVHDAFAAGLDGLQKRGKAALGEKTMVDVLVPALAALPPIGAESLADAVARSVEVARKAADSTIPLVATKGRASYLGERSAGHMDPGALSATLLLQALQEALAST
jgi:dihydroxyacetone kinase-like protein